MSDIAKPATDDGGVFSPQQAAALLTETVSQTRRRIEPTPPWLLVLRALGVLAAGVVVWLSVRGQHPYKGPTAVAIPVIIAFGVVNLVATLAVARRATQGIAGRSRLRPPEIAVLAAVWIGVFGAMAAMAGAGVSRSIVYGVYPATVPLLTAGLAWAVIMGLRVRWRAGGIGLAVAAVGTVGVFTGPAGAWLTMGVGLCAVLLAGAAVVSWQQHHGVVRP